MTCTPPRSAFPPGLRSLALLALLALLAGCNKPETSGAGSLGPPNAEDARAAARQLTERILADYAAAGETDPIGFLARRGDVDPTVIATLQRTMSVDLRDPLRCNAKSVRDYRFDSARSISPTRWIVGMRTSANQRDSFTLEFGADRKWRLAELECA